MRNARRIDFAVSPGFFNHLIYVTMKKSKQASQFNEKQFEILNKMFGFGWDWIENIPSIKNTILKLLLCYVNSEQIEGCKEERELTAFHITHLNDLLENILLFENAATPPIKDDDFCIECIKKEGEIEALESICAQKEKRIEELILGSSYECKLVILK
jgi:hypothetical protein